MANALDLDLSNISVVQRSPARIYNLLTLVSARWPKLHRPIVRPEAVIEAEAGAKVETGANALTVKSEVVGIAIIDARTTNANQ